jgi:hypoxanthine phosphoribosyltransferase
VPRCGYVAAGSAAAGGALLALTQPSHECSAAAGTNAYWDARTVRPATPPATQGRPTWADKYAERILFTEADIAAGIDKLAARLNEDYGGPRPTPPLLVGVLHGVYVTLADLTRKLDFDHDVDFVKAASYGSGITAADVKLTVKMKFDVVGRDIILIDELVESGRTFAATADKMRRMGAKSVKTLCLVDKPSCHKVALDIDYWALQASLGPLDVKVIFIATLFILYDNPQWNIPAAE